MYELQTTLQSLVVGGGGITIDTITTQPQHCQITAHCTTLVASCPTCATPSSSVHSRYRRRLADRTVGTTSVTLQLTVRRFRCRNHGCRQQIFAERLPTLMASRQRSTIRLAHAFQTIGLALGGRPGARVAQALGMPTSHTTMLRHIHQLPIPPITTPTAIGIDEWAWRKRTAYGCIVVDLHTNRVLDLLPDQAQSTIVTWLRQYPSIQIVSRDRGGGFAAAITAALPTATQVVDRWHLIKNYGEALEAALLSKRAVLRAACTPPESAADVPLIDPFVGALTRTGRHGPDAPMLEADISARRERHAVLCALHAQIHTLRATGADIVSIAKMVSTTRATVYRYLAMETPPDWVQPRRRTTLDPYKAFLLQQWTAGCQSPRQLWRMIRAQGFTGAETAVTRYLAFMGCQKTKPRPIIHPTYALNNGRIPSAVHTAQWVLLAPTRRTANQQAFLDAVAAADPDCATLITLSEQFLAMIRANEAAALTAWITAAITTTTGHLHRFAQRLRQDEAAVRAGIAGPWSNGPVEGQIHRLKLLKRQAYGRASLALLRIRLIAQPPAASPP
ncbi:ISL3 family transposase [Herpetosiphon llansteffanensis]|uniref:ISL3 family transposase n=1 Tax=Herpetosiphon llansteffanensis TaxID=2094568 RepID=UPI000F51A79E|nr:ISL3 family transposase [Herpetosiphon llansteffanensis]